MFVLEVGIDRGCELVMCEKRGEFGAKPCKCS